MQRLDLKLEQFPAGAPHALLGYSVAEALALGKLSGSVAGLRLTSEAGVAYDFYPLCPPELEEKCRLNNFEGELYRKYRTLFETDPESDHWGVCGQDKFDLTPLLLEQTPELGTLTHIFLADDFFDRARQTLIIANHEKTQAEDLGSLIGRFAPEAIVNLPDQKIIQGLKLLPEIIRPLRSAWADFDSVIGTIIPHSLFLVELATPDEQQLTTRVSNLTVELSARAIPHRIAASESRHYWKLAKELTGI